MTPRALPSNRERRGSGLAAALAAQILHFPHQGRASGTDEPRRGRRRQPRLWPCDSPAAPSLLSGFPRRSPVPAPQSRPCREAPPLAPLAGHAPWPRRPGAPGPSPAVVRPGRSAMASESVKVVVRCRPMNQRERELNCQPVVTVDSARGQCFIQNPGAADEPPKQFTFDGAYYMDHFTEQIYNEIAYPLVEVRAPRV